MAVKLIREEEAPRLRLLPPEDEPKQTVVDQDALRIQTLSVLHGLSSLLAARLILMLAVLIGGGLGAVATFQGSPGAIVGASLYDALVVIPMVLLAWRKG